MHFCETYVATGKLAYVDVIYKPLEHINATDVLLSPSNIPEAKRITLNNITGSPQMFVFILHNNNIRVFVLFFSDKCLCSEVVRPINSYTYSHVEPSSGKW